MTNARAWARRRVKERKTDEGRGKKNVTTAMMRFVSRTMMTPVARSLARTIMQMPRNVKQSMMMMKMMKIIGVKKNLDFACLLMRVGRSAIFFSFFFHFRHIKKESIVSHIEVVLFLRRGLRFRDEVGEDEEKNEASTLGAFRLGGRRRGRGGAIFVFVA